MKGDGEVVVGVCVGGIRCNVLRDSLEEFLTSCPGRIGPSLDRLGLETASEFAQDCRLAFPDRGSVGFEGPHPGELHARREPIGCMARNRASRSAAPGQSADPDAPVPVRRRP